MQAAHRTVRPLSHTAALALPALRRFGAQPLRAQLDGLEVRESSFGEWLAAGGDRRSQPRAEKPRML